MPAKRPASSPSRSRRRPMRAHSSASPSARRPIARAIAPCSSTAARPAACGGPGSAIRLPQRMPRASTGTISQSSSRHRRCVAPLARATMGGARAELPIGEQLLLQRRRRLARDDLVGEVLEDDRRTERLRELVDDEVGGRTAQRECGEPLAHLVARAQRLGLGGDDPPVHRLGERDELHLAMQCDQSESLLTGRLDDDRGHVAIVSPEFEHEPGEPGVDELADEAPQLIGFGRPRRSGGQQQLAAVEQSRDAGAVGDVHPAHPRIERVAADQHLRPPWATASSAITSRTVGSVSWPSTPPGRSVRLGASSRRSGRHGALSCSAMRDPHSLEDRRSICPVRTAVRPRESDAPRDRRPGHAAVAPRCTPARHSSTGGNPIRPRRRITFAGTRIRMDRCAGMNWREVTLFLYSAHVGRRRGPWARTTSTSRTTVARCCAIASTSTAAV